MTATEKEQLQFLERVAAHFIEWDVPAARCGNNRWVAQRMGNLVALSWDDPFYRHLRAKVPVDELLTPKGRQWALNQGW